MSRVTRARVGENVEPAGPRMRTTELSATNRSRRSRCSVDVLGTRREDPLEGDDEGQHQVGRHVVVALPVSGAPNGSRMHHYTAFARPGCRWAQVKYQVGEKVRAWL